MVKVVFGLDVDCWIEGVEVEGDNYDDCYDKLMNMTVGEMLDAGGYVKQDTREDIDGEIIEDDEEDEDEDWSDDEDETDPDDTEEE